MKKIFIISIVLLGATLLFLGIYNFAFKKEAPKTTEQVIKATTPVVEEVKKQVIDKKNEKIVAVSEQLVLGVTLEKKTEEIKYYDIQNGTVWKIDSFGKGKKQISETKLSGLKNVLWSSDNNKVITSIEKDGKNSFYEYDYSLQKGTQLKNGLDTAVWDNTGAKILYKYFDESTKERTLNIANPDGSGWQKITDIEARKLSIAPVPLSSMVSFWNFPTAKEETKLQIVGITGGETKTILKGRFGGDYLWSPDGSKALVSSLLATDSKMTSLGLVTIAGEYHELNIPTLVTKCTWSEDSKTLYYALPGGIPDNSIMPDDYQENKFFTNDTFWKMDVTTGEKERIVNTEDINGKYDSNKLFLSATEDALYFINKVDQKLYRIEL